MIKLLVTYVKHYKDWKSLQELWELSREL